MLTQCVKDTQRHTSCAASSETTPTGTKTTPTRKNTETTCITQDETSVSCTSTRTVVFYTVISGGTMLTHFGVRIGLQAGSSCCVNLESAHKSAPSVLDLYSKFSMFKKEYFFVKDEAAARHIFCSGGMRLNILAILWCSWPSSI